MSEIFEFCIAVANVPIKIKALSPDMRNYCRQYQIPDDSKVQMEIEVVEDDLKLEAEYLRKMHAPDYKFDARILEFDAIHRKIADAILDYDVLLFHASAISVDSKAILFSAPSGTGKSTHTRFWKELYGERVEIINDDKPLIRCEESGVKVYGSPWNGKDRLSSLNSADFETLCFLNRGMTNVVERVSQQEIMREVFSQVHIPEDKSKLKKVLFLLNRILKEAKLYRISCTNSIESAKVVSKELLKQ